MTNCDLASAQKAIQKYSHLNHTINQNLIIGPADQARVWDFITCSIDRSAEYCRGEGPYTVYVVTQKPQEGFSFVSLQEFLR